MSGSKTDWFYGEQADFTTSEQLMRCCGRFIQTRVNYYYYLCKIIEILNTKENFQMVKILCILLQGLLADCF